MSVGHASDIETALARLAAGRSSDPFGVLGPHPDESSRGTVIRVFQPAARSVALRLASGDVPMKPRSPEGLYEATVDLNAPDYRLRVTYSGDHAIDLDDPYRYGRVLTDFDLHLL